MVQIGSVQSQELDQIWRKCGERGAAFGNSIANLGDINHDGIEDFAATKYLPHNHVEVFLGGNPPSDTPSLIFSIPPSDSFYIWSIGNVGDINGDGWDDFAILCSYGSCDEYKVNKLHVYYSGVKFDTIPDFTLTGYADGRFGFNLKGVGDVNNDGYDDIAVFIFRSIGSKHKVKLFFGGDPMDKNPDWEFESTGDDFSLGYNIVGNMDFNNDEIEDLALYGNYRQEDDTFHSAYLVFWGGEHLDSAPDLVVEAGIQVTGSSTLAGDFNGDSFTDLVMFAGRNCEPMIYFGINDLDTQSDLSLERGTTSASEWTMEVKAVGDINNDGCDDIIAGFHGLFDYMGQILVYLGSQNMDGVPDLQWKSFMSSERLRGKHHTFCADVTGDGVDDIVFSDGQKRGCIGIWAGDANIKVKN